jgi:hypothetical protein
MLSRQLLLDPSFHPALGADVDLVVHAHDASAADDTGGRGLQLQRRPRADLQFAAHEAP